jgi:hypothetical protein
VDIRSDPWIARDGSQRPFTLWDHCPRLVNLTYWSEHFPVENGIGEKYLLEEWCRCYPCHSDQTWFWGFLLCIMTAKLISRWYRPTNYIHVTEMGHKLLQCGLWWEKILDLNTSDIIYLASCTQ